MNREKIRERELKIIFMGTPQFAVATLDRLHLEGYNIAAVVTAPDRAKGRGLKIAKSAVKERAEELGLKVLAPPSLKDPLFIEDLKKIGAHLYIVVAFRMLPKEVWSLPPLGCFNLHASLLPQYRGAAPINRAIMEGEKRTGVTTFLLDHQIDTGKILLQESVAITPLDNAGSLHNKLMERGANLVVETVRALLKGSLFPTPQSALIKEGEPLKKAPKLSTRSGKIEWELPSFQIVNLVRGLSPYPGAYTNLCEGESLTRVKIFEVKNLPDNYTLKAGEGRSDSDRELIIGCGEGAVSVLSLQLEGRKRVSIEQFLRGRRGEQNFIFRS
ncbi:MAG: methionyl-tRNA formyltransferase [Bacteroidales bacterium]